MQILRGLDEWGAAEGYDKSKTQVNSGSIIQESNRKSREVWGKYRQAFCVNSKKGFLSQELFRCEMTP